MTMPNFRLHRKICCIGLSLSLMPVWADQVILDDLIVNGSQCVGVDCIDGEEFDFDTVKIKSSSPQIRFLDTSTTAGFPTNDWRMGITDDMVTGTTLFYIKDEGSGLNALQIQAAESGGVALGAGSAIVPNAISVGAPGAERPIVNVAPGTNDTDAVNAQQFEDFQNQVEADNADAIAATQARIDELNLRIDGLLDKIDMLQNTAF